MLSSSDWFSVVASANTSGGEIADVVDIFPDEKEAASHKPHLHWSCSSTQLAPSHDRHFQPIGVRCRTWGEDDQVHQATQT